MTPAEYEQLVADIAGGIREGAADLQDLVLASAGANRLPGASSYRHQIDVSLEGPKRVFLIECKRWDEKVGVEEVLVLAARASDILQARPGCAVRAILVSKVD